MHFNEFIQPDAIPESTYPSHLQTALPTAEPAYVSVKHYDSCRPYKDMRGRSKWSKLPLATLHDDPAYLALDWASRGLYLELCALACRHENRLPNNPELLAQWLMSKTTVDLNPLFVSGFLVKFRAALSRPRTPVDNPRAGVCKKDLGVGSKSEEIKNEEKKEGELRELRLGARTTPATVLKLPIPIGPIKTPFPPGWKYSDDHRELATAFGLNVHVEFLTFRDRSKRDGTLSADWDAGFNYWLRKGKEFKAHAAGRR